MDTGRFQFAERIRLKIWEVVSITSSELPHPSLLGMYRSLVVTFSGQIYSDTKTSKQGKNETFDKKKSIKSPDNQKQPNGALTAH